MLKLETIINPSEVVFEKKPYIQPTGIFGVLIIKDSLFVHPDATYQTHFNTTDIEKLFTSRKVEIYENQSFQFEPGRFLPARSEMHDTVITPTYGELQVETLDLRIDSPTHNRWVIFQFSVEDTHLTSLFVPKGVGISFFNYGSEAAECSYTGDIKKRFK
jgi:hypothetical protein